ncbi:MAG: hypothetical protein ACRCTZ_07980 [Sarcina sp.]
MALNQERIDIGKKWFKENVEPNIDPKKVFEASEKGEHACYFCFDGFIPENYAGTDKNLRAYLYGQGYEALGIQEELNEWIFNNGLGHIVSYQTMVNSGVRKEKEKYFFNLLEREIFIDQIVVSLLFNSIWR